jgi:4-aminobutyrate aminotransferase
VGLQFFYIDGQSKISFKFITVYVINFKMRREKIPYIKVKPPGEKAIEWVKRDNQYVSSSYTRTYPLVVEKAYGMTIEDVDGNRYLDFTAGIATCSTGHCHPRITEAITRQANRLIHMSGTDFYYPSQINLAMKLSDITPGRKDKMVFFGNSGAEAIEASFKLARYHTKRTLIIAFFGAFHGRTMGALSLTASKVVQRKRFRPLVPGVSHVPYAYCYRCPNYLTYPDCNIQCVEWIEDVLFRTTIPPEEVAAIIVEPIQGEGGYIVPPKEFHQRLFQLAKKYGILYVADEVQSGMGRTGKFLASEHFDVIPDIVAMAKGIASGMPLGVAIASSEIMDWGPGSHASTFGGNPVSCEAALETIKLLEEGLIENAKTVGNFMIERLQDMKKRYEIIGDVRGKGLMIGVELVKDRETKERAEKERGEIIYKCFENGLLLLGCGPNSIRFMPPLIVSREEADTALTIFEKVIAACQR